MDRLPINWALMRNPINWLIVCLMVIFGLMVFELVAKWATNNVNPKLPAPFRPTGDDGAAAPSISDPETAVLA